MNLRDNYNIAIVGLGNVGSEVYRHLVKNKRAIEINTNSTFQIKYISAKTISKKRGFSIPKKMWVKNPLALVKKNDVDIIIELIGSSEGVAKKLVFAALKNNKHVITANKALIFKHGNELAKIAEKNSVNLLFEASVGGGIPIIKSIKESLVGNKLFHIYGVLNGTTNFILTEIERTKKSFKEILSIAKKLGYAETNPKLDLNGDDAKSKIAILSALCFKNKIINKSFLTEGIERIDLEDVEYAHQFKYKIKLLGISEIIDNKIKQRVHPCLISKDSDLAKISGANNAIMVEGNPVGKIVYQGLGAGKGPTTSSIISDFSLILKGNVTLPFGFNYSDAKEFKMFDFDNHVCKFYLRLVVKDKPGVLSKITYTLSKHKISIQSILQEPLDNTKYANLVIITHNAKERDMRLSLNKISKEKFMAKKITMIRIRNEKKL
jgi:homoserine dehydrogenase